MARDMRCVCDAHAVLHTQELTPGLSALTCEACEGQLLSLHDYRRWLDRRLHSDGHDVKSGDLQADLVTEPATAPTPARKCPTCAVLMDRLHSGCSDEFRLDRCGPCQLLWMDAGEWNALCASDLRQSLLEVLSDAGQRGIREALVRRRREVELRARYGDAEMDELARMRTWLLEQPHTDHLLTLLRNGW